MLSRAARATIAFGLILGTALLVTIGGLRAQTIEVDLTTARAVVPEATAIGAFAGTPFESLFGLPGVVSVFATANFVTVTKAADADWGAILEPAKSAISQAF